MANAPDIVTPTGQKSPHLKERAGEEYDEQKFNTGILRADLCELAQEVSFQHGARIVDAILKQYDVKRKSISHREV